MFCAMRQNAVADLLAEIERSGSGSVAFWELFWSAFHQLSGDEIRRVLTTTGHRSVRYKLGMGFWRARVDGGDEASPWTAQPRPSTCSPPDDAVPGTGI
jgi:hypothetical protein